MKLHTAFRKKKLLKPKPPLQEIGEEQEIAEEIAEEPVQERQLVVATKPRRYPAALWDQPFTRYYGGFTKEEIIKRAATAYETITDRKLTGKFADAARNIMDNIENVWIDPTLKRYRTWTADDNSRTIKLIDQTTGQSDVWRRSMKRVLEDASKGPPIWHMWRLALKAMKATPPRKQEKPDRVSRPWTTRKQPRKIQSSDEDEPTPDRVSRPWTKTKGKKQEKPDRISRPWTKTKGKKQEDRVSRPWATGATSPVRRSSRQRKTSMSVSMLTRLYSEVNMLRKAMSEEEHALPGGTELPVRRIRTRWNDMIKRMQEYAFDLDDESVKWNIHTFPLPDVFKAGSDEWAIKGRGDTDLFGIKPTLGRFSFTPGEPLESERYEVPLVKAEPSPSPERSSAEKRPAIEVSDDLENIAGSAEYSAPAAKKAAPALKPPKKRVPPPKKAPPKKAPPKKAPPKKAPPKKRKGYIDASRVHVRAIRKEDQLTENVRQILIENNITDPADHRKLIELYRKNFGKPNFDDPMVLTKYRALVKEFLLVKKPTKEPLMIMAPPLTLKRPSVPTTLPPKAHKAMIDAIDAGYAASGAKAEREAEAAELAPELHAVIPYMKPSPKRPNPIKSKIYISPPWRRAQQKFSRRLMSVGKRKTCRSSI